MEDNIRLPQTCKILFGGATCRLSPVFVSDAKLVLGCHDNGYATTLRSFITAGFQDKLILLRGYSESAASIEELGLPTMTVPQLFLADKLVSSHNALPGIRHGRSRSGSFADIVPHSFRTTSPLPPSSLQSSSIVTEDAVATSAPPTSSPGEILVLEPDPLPFATEPITIANRPAPPPSYKSALQGVVHPVRERPNTPELDPAGSSASSDTSDEAPTDPRASPTLTKSRHINPNIVSIYILELRLHLISLSSTATF